MGDNTAIEWTEATWNPVAGCSILSPGCTNCYAMKMAHRIEAMDAALGHAPQYRGLTKKTKAGAVWTGKMSTASNLTVTQPLRWKRPRRIFVNSMSDLFHEGVADETIDRIFAVMALSPQHTFQVLTKRAKRMRDYMTADGGFGRWGYIEHQARKLANIPNGKTLAVYGGSCLPNVWLGVSTEDQARANERIPHLLATPAAKRFLSCEPLLGPVDLLKWFDPTGACCGGEPEFRCDNCPADAEWRYSGQCTAESLNEPRLDLVIIGGESGPRSRPFMLSWAAALIEQCRDAGVAAFMKQVGAEAYDDRSYIGSSPRFETKDKKGGDMSEWPEDLRVRELPT